MTVPSDRIVTAPSARLRSAWWLAYATVVGGGVLIAVFSRNRFTQPYLPLTLAALGLLVLAWTRHRRAALYATLFLTAVGDTVTAWWFPFTKNLSSRESISFVADSVPVSPLEISLLAGFVVTTLHNYSQTGKFLKPSPLVRPLLVFTAFLVTGLIRGVVMRGGDVRIALTESRGMFYILIVYVIVTSVCTSDRELRRALASVIGGVVVHALLAMRYLDRLDPEVREGLDSLIEHGAALTMNVLLVTLIASLIFRDVPKYLPWVLGVMSIPVLYVYLVSERRAAVAALSTAGAVLLIVLFWRNRRRFWKVAPLIIVTTGAYVGAFWTSQSTIGFPAQAIKTVIAPGQASDADLQSNLYRLAENFNVNYTIRSSPVFGLGFGHQFYRPVALPGITPFDLAAFVPHNSFLWVWIKLGFFGFLAMIYLFSAAIIQGARRIRLLPDGIDVVVTMAALGFVVMYPVFTWVDISWDVRNTPVLGLAMAICASPVARARRQRRSAADGQACSTASATTSATEDAYTSTSA